LDVDVGEEGEGEGVFGGCRFVLFTARREKDRENKKAEDNYSGFHEDVVFDFEKGKLGIFLADSTVFDKRPGRF
jgi:hypothetical protein